MTQGTIPVEVLAWVTKFVGGNGSQRRMFDEPLPSDATVRTVLRGLSARFPELQQALWNGKDLAEHVEVLVNDAVLGVSHELDSPVKADDRISLVGAYLGRRGVKLSIDGRDVELGAGGTVLDAVNQLGVPLPQLCKDPDRAPLGACRTCLVRVEGVRGFPAACHLPARDGMIVSTEHPDVVRVRRGVLDLTLSMLTPSAERDGFGQLGVAAERHALARPTWAPLHPAPVDATKSFFVLDREACILCGRCAVACDDVQHIGAIALLSRSHDMKVGVARDGAMSTSVCTSCGQCVATCPTGALRPKETPLPVARRVETTCPYCGVGCGVELAVRTDGRLAVMADDVPVNRSSEGMLCVKGRFGTGFVHARDRIVQPRIRRDGQWQDTSWGEALDFAADGLARHRGRFGALASAKATNEDAYVIQKFVRAVMDTNNVDHCTRLCHSPSVEAMLASMGSGATSNSYQDYEEAGCLMVVGADASANHPVIAVRFRRAMKRGAKLIVINPKRVELCDQADLWLQPRPGTDVMLFNAMARVILDEGLADEDFIAQRTEGVEAWRASVADASLEHAADVTGIPAEDIAQAARWYARPPYSGSCLIWGMGITQHTNGIHNAHALLNLSLVAGQLGREASGISPLRGQNNVQGCGDSGCIPSSLPGYQSFVASNLDRFESVWGTRPPAQPGKVVTEMVECFLTGEIRAMYVVGENPLLSEPDLHHAEKAFAQLDFLVVQDLFLHETAERADVFLPAAAFAEKEGTFTNSERRVQRVRKAIEPAGDARPDWWITAELAKRVAVRLGRDVSAQFAWRSASEVFDELARLTPFLGGISHARLDRDGGLQWPCPTPDHPGTRFLYGESFPLGKARFIPARQLAAAAELPDPDFPFLLNTGRLLYHWHGGTLTRRVEGLLELAPRLEVAIHPSDARRLGVETGGALRVSSRRGELTGYARVTEAVRPGAIFVPFVKLADSAANFLTNAALDPGSKIPEYKVCAVRVERVPRRLTDPFTARLARREWTITVEVVTPPPDDHASRARIMTLADALREGAGGWARAVGALTLTDRTASPDADPVAFAPLVRERAGAVPLVHLAGKARDARGFTAALDGCAAAEIASVLLTGGDAVPNAPGGLDALEMLALARERVPGIVPLGVLALPRALRGAVSGHLTAMGRQVQWERTLAKRAAGAEAFMAQVSWDLSEREIVAEWQARLTAPILGAVVLLTRGRLAFLAEHRIGGIVVPAPLRARAAAEDLAGAARRLALDIALLRRLGYAGAHVSGVLTPPLLRDVLDDAARLDASLGADWRDVWRAASGIA